MGGIKKWQHKEIAFIRAATDAGLTPSEIVTRFASLFKDANHDVDESSVKYCRNQYTVREEYNPDGLLAGVVPGTKGYLLGLYAHGLQPSQIVDCIEEQYPTHKWPGIRANSNQSITKTDAVEIAIATYHEHADLYKKESLLDKYPNTENSIVKQVLSWNLGLPGLPDLRNFTYPPSEEDDVIFILTRFGGLAPRLPVNPSAPQVFASGMAPANQPASGGFSSQYLN